MKKVMDAHGLLAFMGKEPGYEQVKAFIIAAAENDDYLLMPSVNYGGVYYIIGRSAV